jgi:outer membrane receptor protein involved in Fe transport
MQRKTLLAQAGRFALALAMLGGGAHAAWAQQAAIQAAAVADAAAPATTVTAVTVQSETVTTAPAVLPVTTPYSGSTITAVEVRDLPDGPTVNLETMLQNQPSVFAYSNGPLGVGTNIFFRGFNAGQFAQTYDNVAINDVFNGGVTGSADTVDKVLLLPRNVDSVELFRGINNPDVNSYNSLGGTINFLPRQPSATAGGLIGGGYGSFDTYDVHAEYNTGDIEGVRQLFTYDHAESNGWVPNTPARNTNIFYSASYDSPSKLHVGLVLVYNNNHAYTPFQMPVPLLQANGGYFQYPTSEAFENDRDSEYMAILDVRAPITSKITLDQKFFAGDNNYLRTSYANPADYESAAQPYELYNQGTTSYFWKPSFGYVNGPTYVPANVFGSTVNGTDYHLYEYSSWGYGWQPQMTFDLPHNFVTVGGNITVARLHSAEYWYGSAPVPELLDFNDAWDEHDERVLGSIYIQDNIHLFDDRLSVTPGVKYIYAYTEDHDNVGIFYPFPGNPKIHDSFVAPTIGINYKVTDNLGLFLSFGENFKLPDITALFDAVPGNASPTNTALPPTLAGVKPEYVYDYEFGARYLQGGFSAEVDFYREDFFNTFIDSFDETTDSTFVSNGGSSRYQGVEVRLQDDFRLGRYGDVLGFVNYSYNQAFYTSSFHADSVGVDENDADAVVTKGEEMPDVPAQLVSFGATWRSDGYRATVRGRYIGPQQTLDFETGIPDGVKLEGYFVMDLGLEKIFKIYNSYAKTLKVGLDFNNLLNKYYFNYADTSTEENHFGTLTEFASPGAPRNVMGRIEVGF